MTDFPQDLKETSKLDELSGKVVVTTTYDNSAVLELNKKEKVERAGMQKYKGNLVHAARVHMGDIVRLKNMGYNLLSPDPEEVRRGLLYLQSEEKHMLTVDGTPFAKKRLKWA